MQLTAKLIKVFPQIERGTFTSRKVWLEIPDGQYPQTIEVEVSQGKVNIFTDIAIGATVTVDCNLRGKVVDWKGEQKCFWSLSVWKVTAAGSAPTTRYNGVTGYAEKVTRQQYAQPWAPPVGPVQDDNSDLPF